MGRGAGRESEGGRQPAGGGGRRSCRRQPLLQTRPGSATLPADPRRRLPHTSSACKLTLSPLFLWSADLRHRLPHVQGLHRARPQGRAPAGEGRRGRLGGCRGAGRRAPSPTALHPPLTFHPPPPSLQVFNTFDPLSGVMSPLDFSPPTSQLSRLPAPSLRHQVYNTFNPFSGFMSPTYILKSAKEVSREQVAAVLKVRARARAGSHRQPAARSCRRPGRRRRSACASRAALPADAAFTPVDTAAAHLHLYPIQPDYTVKPRESETYDIYLVPPGEDPETCQSWLRMRYRDGRYNLMFEEWVVEVRWLGTGCRAGVCARRHVCPCACCAGRAGPGLVSRSARPARLLPLRASAQPPCCSHPHPPLRAHPRAAPHAGPLHHLPARDVRGAGAHPGRPHGAGLRDRLHHAPHLRGLLGQRVSWLGRPAACLVDWPRAACIRGRLPVQRACAGAGRHARALAAWLRPDPPQPCSLGRHARALAAWLRPDPLQPCSLTLPAG